MTENYKKQLAEGKKYEKYIKEQLYLKRHLQLDIIDDELEQYSIGETKQGYEIKYDKRFQETGNLYIEYAEKTNAQNYKFVESGIFRKDNTHTWIIGNYKEAFMFLKKSLQTIYSNGNAYRVETDTSKGILLNKELIDKYSIDYINFE